jgi:translation initiation factor IF-2
MGETVILNQKKNIKQKKDKLNKIENVLIEKKIKKSITIRELSEKINIKSEEILKKFSLINDKNVNIDKKIDIDLIELLANEFGYYSKIKDNIVCFFKNEKKLIIHNDKDVEIFEKRSPIVTIMGHVDHGKTSLLDLIRSSDITKKEYGGITQHIGAYKVKTKTEQYISFIDTPGHEAFTEMRRRGAQVTDIIVLVVSAVDSVMPQTIEAINHAKFSNVPIIVAINKIDLPLSNIQKVKQDLSNYDLVPEEWGGDTIMIDISVKQNINIDLLLEMILLKAELMELKTNKNKNADGFVLETKLDSKKGLIATFLVKNGTLKVGDNFVVGSTCGKVRAMFNEFGEKVNIAVPSTPIEVLGFEDTPQVGDCFVVVSSIYEARNISNSKKRENNKILQKQIDKTSILDANVIKTKKLNIILKTDVQGSIGAITDAIHRLQISDEINLKIIHKSTGVITKSDVSLAIASGSLIFGFNLKHNSNILKFAESENVVIKNYRVIYDLISDVKSAIEGLLEPDIKEKILGKAVVKQLFKIPKIGIIFGCFVLEGKMQRGSQARLIRDNVIIFESTVLSLKILKNDVKEVDKDYECGIGIENYSDIKIGDIIENFIVEKITKKL